MASPERGLVGRRDELDLLSRWLGRGELPVVVVGPGGIGKTTLARAAAGEQGVARDWLVDLSLARSLDDVVSALAGDRVHARSSVFEQVVARLTRAQPPLVVLDCADHVCAELADVLGRLAEAAPGVRYLITSRTEIPLRSARVLRLDPLPCPAELAGPAEIAASAAVELFVERTRLRLPDFEIEAGNAARIAELVRRVDGLPLAIELVASKMHALSLQEILGQLEEGSLSWRARDVPARHQSLRHTVEWSWHGLPEPLQRAAAALSVHRGPFDVAAARALLEGVSGEPLAALDELCACSLLLSEPGDEGAVAYRYLDFIATFVREHLDQLDIGARARENHALHYAELARRLVRRQPVPGHDRRRSRARANAAANCAAAIEWVSARGAAEDHAWLALASSQAQLELGQFERARQVLELTAARAGELPAELVARLHAAREMVCLFTGAPLSPAPAPSSAAPASALFASALECLLTGDLEAGRRHVAAALAALAREDDTPTAALTHVIAIVIDAASGRPDAGDGHFESALAALRRHDVLEVEILAWMVHGVAHMLASRVPQAQAALSRAAQVAEVVDAAHLSATVDICRGWIAASRGEVAAALEHLGGARRIADATGATRGRGWCHYFAAVALLRDQRHSEALVELEQAHDTFARDRALYFLSLIECRRTIALAQLGRAEAAAEAHEAAQRYAARVTGTPLDLVVALDGLHVAIAGGADRAELRGRYDDLLAAVRERGLERYEPIVESTVHLEPLLSRGRDALVLSDDYSEVRIGERRIDLQRQASARRMLRALAEAGRSLTVLELFAAGWPDDDIPTSAAIRRVYSGIHSLRKQGLEPFLRHTGDGYALVAQVELGARATEPRRTGSTAR